MLFYLLEYYPIDWFNPVLENENDVKINWGDDYFYGIPYYSSKILNKDDRWLYVFNKLLEKGINLNQKTKYGWTILHFSIFMTSNDDIYNIFVSHGADEKIVTPYGRSPKDLKKYVK